MSRSFARSVAGSAVGLAAAAWAVREYRSSFDLAETPHDLAVFLRAAAAVIGGESPYAYRDDQTYAYPPLLAYLVAPLESLDPGTATAVWTALSLAAVVGALLLLGVRDWRCHAIALAAPATAAAIHLGTVNPLLLLAVAAAWRFRDRAVAAGAAAGAAIALKLFLWPLAAWLVATRRIAASAATVAFAAVFALAPWAVLGFGGLGGYPGLLRRLADDEGSASYSVVAFVVRAHLPETAGLVVSIGLALALLGGAVWAGGDAARPRRDRDAAALTFALAAALAVSPIVWHHYFMLLLAPLALVRPRLSPLWLVPLATFPLGETAWPGGDARKLALALAFALALLAAGAFAGRAAPWGRTRPAISSWSRPSA